MPVLSSTILHNDLFDESFEKLIKSDWDKLISSGFLTVPLISKSTSTRQSFSLTLFTSWGLLILRYGLLKITKHHSRQLIYQLYHQ